MDEDEHRALLRVRTLRHDGYRCQYRESAQAPVCGAFSSAVGQLLTDESLVALCRLHAPLEVNHDADHLARADSRRP